MSQDFYLPLMARSVGLPAIPQGLQIQGAFDHQPTKTEDAKKQVGPAEPAAQKKLFFVFGYLRKGWNILWNIVSSCSYHLPK